MTGVGRKYAFDPARPISSAERVLSAKPRPTRTNSEGQPCSVKQTFDFIQRTGTIVPTRLIRNSNDAAKYTVICKRNNEMEGIIFIGIQASGKSTFYQRFFYKTHVRISLDMLKTRNRESIILNACIEAKQPFVIDNTNPSIEEREKYIIVLRENGVNIKGYYFQSNITDCLERNRLREGKDNIPNVGIKGTYNKLELPSYNEDFDELFYVSMKHSEFIVKEWKNEV